MKKAMQICQVNNMKDLESDYFEHDGDLEDWRLHATDSFQINWNTNSKEHYEKVEDIISKKHISLSNGTLSAWCDGSGYGYWGKEFDGDREYQEWNYVMLTFHASTPYITQDEVNEIEQAIQDLYYDVLSDIRPLCTVIC